LTPNQQRHADDAMLMTGEWISSAEALDWLVQRRVDPVAGAASLLIWAASDVEGLSLRAKAKSYKIEPSTGYGSREQLYDVIVHRWIWRSNVDLADHATGTFKLKNMEFNYDITLLGVEYSLDDLELIVPQGSQKPATPDPVKTRRSGGGRPPAPWWPTFAAELAVYVHEVGLPAGTGAMGQGEMIEAIQTRMVENGHHKAPDRSSIQAVVQEVLDRLRPE